MKKRSTKNLAIAAMIAAVYTVLALSLGPVAFGGLQFRVSEALGLLAVFSPVAIWGVTLGCFLANLIGVLLGVNPMPFDILFGTLATLVSAVLTYLFRGIRFKNIPFLAAVPPVIVNAAVIGFELSVFTTGGFSIEAFVAFALQVGAGQLAACFAIGLILVYTLEKTGLARRLFDI